MLPIKYLPFLKLFLINPYRRENYQMTGYMLLPQSSKKETGTLRQTTGRYPLRVLCQITRTHHLYAKLIMSHFSKNNLLTPVQHGFRSKRSCESQLLITADKFIQNFESKTQKVVVVLDFRKASFDIVPHQRLLHKLDHYEPTICRRYSNLHVSISFKR